MFVWVSCPNLVGFSSILASWTFDLPKVFSKIRFGVVVGCVLVLENVKRKREKKRITTLDTSKARKNRKTKAKSEK